MKTLIREIPLSNGLTVRFFDATRRYFGDYHQVRVTISCEVPLTADLFADVGAWQAAVKLLGNSLLYKKEIEHQGVPTADTARAIEKVISQFMEHSLAYFQTETFAKRFVQSELTRVKGKAKSFVPLHANG
jgi:hypothetical protein